jgi:TonB family protein
MTKSRTLTLFLASSLALSSFSLPALAHDSEDRAAARWAKKIEWRVDRYMDYPVQAAIRKEQGLVQIRAELAPDGTITSKSVVGTSGSEYLDKAALRLVKRLGALPKPPRLDGKQVDAVRFHLLYALAPATGRLTARDHLLRRKLGKTEIRDLITKNGGKPFKIVMETSASRAQAK